MRQRAGIVGCRSRPRCCLCLDSVRRLRESARRTAATCSRFGRTRRKPRLQQSVTQQSFSRIPPLRRPWHSLSDASDPLHHPRHITSPTGASGASCRGRSRDAARLRIRDISQNTQSTHFNRSLDLGILAAFHVIDKSALLHSNCAEPSKSSNASEDCWFRGRRHSANAAVGDSPPKNAMPLERRKGLHRLNVCWNVRARQPR